jgi:uncharacterized protein DUF4160
MPTVLRFVELRVVDYLNDHRPAHVHVIRNGCEALVNLNCPDGPLEVRENYRFSKPEISKIEDELTECANELCRAGEKIHEIA